MKTITKRFGEYPIAHRQPKHRGHCALIHGHNLVFDITFRAETLDECGFIVDYGKMATLKQILESKFDHTLLLAHDDPEMPTFLALREKGVATIIVLQDISAEGTALAVSGYVNMWIASEEDLCDRGVEVVKVVCWEDSKNSATYEE